MFVGAKMRPNSRNGNKLINRHKRANSLILWIFPQLLDEKEEGAGKPVTRKRLEKRKVCTLGTRLFFHRGHFYGHDDISTMQNSSPTTRHIRTGISVN